MTARVVADVRPDWSVTAHLNRGGRLAKLRPIQSKPTTLQTGRCSYVSAQGGGDYLLNDIDDLVVLRIYNNHLAFHDKK